MSILFRIKTFFRNRRWKKYWAEQDSRNHIEFYRKLGQEWRAGR